MDEIGFLKLGETYIKLDLEYSEKNKRFLTKILEEYISTYPHMDKYPEGEFKISIDFEKGSLKTKVGVWLTAICIGISNYGSFRSGLREVINDAHSFSEYIIDNVKSSSRIKSSTILRTEKRTGLTGRLQELYQRIGRLERNAGDITLRNYEKELGEIKQEVANMLAIINESDKELFLADLDEAYKQQLPLPDDRRTTYLISRYALKSDDEIEVLEEKKGKL